MKRGPTRHVFQHADPPDVDALGVEWCASCNLPHANAIHQLPQRDPAEKAFEARKTGDR